MDVLKDYARQPSTWLGLIKLGVAFGLFSSGVGSAVSALVVAALGVVDVVRKEQTKQK